MLRAVLDSAGHGLNHSVTSCNDPLHKPMPIPHGVVASVSALADQAGAASEIRIPPNCVAWVWRPITHAVKDTGGGRLTLLLPLK